jgi:hypothetical protein
LDFFGMSDIGPAPGSAKPRRAPLPAWVYMLASIVLSAAPFILLWLGGAERIRDFFFAAYDEFGQMSPFTLIPVYLNALSACDYLAQIDEYNCSTSRFFNPLRLFGALFVTAASVWESSDWLGGGALILLLACGFALSVAAVKRLLNIQEAHIGTVLLASAAAPFAASLTALALQGAAMLLSLIAAYIIVGLLFAAGVLKAGWKTFKTVKDTMDNARTLEDAHKRAAGLPENPPRQ